MDIAEWQRLSPMRFHIIVGRDELVSGSNDMDTACSLAASLSSGRKVAMQVVDTRGGGYIRYWNGKQVERCIEA